MQLNKIGKVIKPSTKQTQSNVWNPTALSGIHITIKSLSAKVGFRFHGYSPLPTR